MSINLGMIKFLLSIHLSFFLWESYIQKCMYMYYCIIYRKESDDKESEKKKQASSSKEISKRNSKKKQNFNEMKCTR